MSKSIRLGSKKKDKECTTHHSGEIGEDFHKYGQQVRGLLSNSLEKRLVTNDKKKCATACPVKIKEVGLKKHARIFLPKTRTYGA